MLDRILKMIGMERSEIRIGNCISCHVPGDWLIGAPWESAALNCTFCNTQLDSLLSEGHPVVVTLGGTALRKVMGFPRARGKEEGGIRVQDFHGAPMRDPKDRFWVVPTFHPSHLNRGEHRLIRTVAYDLSVAREVASGEWKPDVPSLIVDPPIDWFEEWAEAYLSLADRPPLAVDTETPGKLKPEDELEEDESEIVAINFSYSTEEGLTIPWSEPYIEVARAVLLAKGIKVLHNAPFDLKVLRRAGISIPWASVRDSMDLWHVLQSSLPRGLGFVAPFYSAAPAWKHLGNRDGIYKAMDGVQTLRVFYGVEKDLAAEGLTRVAQRYCTLMDALCFRPAEEVGLLFNRERLVAFGEELRVICSRLDGEIQEIVPEVVKPLVGSLVRRPDEEGIVEQVEEVLVQVCKRCGAEQIAKSHRCEDLKGGAKRVRGPEDGVQERQRPNLASIPADSEGAGGVGALPRRDLQEPRVILEARQVSRFYRREPFNPASWQQVLDYIKFRKHKPGKAKKTAKDSTDKKTLRRLVKTGDPLYPRLLDFRAAAKIKGTYADGMLKRMDSGARVHPTFTHGPSTLRTACRDPNLQNIANHVSYASGFRRCVVAAPGSVLLAFDFAGIEAVETGWFAGDPDYIRLAKLGVHAFVASHLVGKPADLAWDESRLRSYFAQIKAEHPEDYDRAKRCVHGASYGLTPYGMTDYYPEVFPKKSDAQKVYDLFFSLAPTVKAFHARVRKFAHEKRVLGGPVSGRAQDHDARYWEIINEAAHPFGMKHHFWNVLNFKRGRNGEWLESLGEDAKRCVAFFPQSAAAGVIYEAMLRLWEKESPLSRIFNGSTCLRALIHDELFLEVPEEAAQRVTELVVQEMTRPIIEQPCPRAWGLGDYLSVGVAGKVGRNWGPWSAENPEGMRAIAGLDALIASDVSREEEDEEAS